MPLVECPDCGRDVSDRALSYLVCGCPITDGTDSGGRGDLLVVVCIFCAAQRRSDR